MLQVKQCCCCFSLRTGSIIIGSLSLVAAILNVIMMGLQTTNMNIPQESPSQMMSRVLVKMFIVTILIYLVMHSIISICLIVGAVKRISSYVFPFVAMTFGSVITAFCMALGFSIVAAVDVNAQVFLIVLVTTFASTALEAYFLQVVYSHYSELVEEKFGHSKPPTSGKVLAMPPYHNV